MHRIRISWDSLADGTTASTARPSVVTFEPTVLGLPGRRYDGQHAPSARIGPTADLLGLPGRRYDGQHRNSPLANVNADELGLPGRRYDGQHVVGDAGL